MNVAGARVVDKSLFVEFLEKEQQIKALQTTLFANGQTKLAQRLRKLELALGNVREKLVELSESIQPTDAELVAAYDSVIDLIKIVDEILDRSSASAAVPGETPLVA